MKRAMCWALLRAPLVIIWALNTYDDVRRALKRKRR